MNGAAEAVMRELPDLVLAYGNSDEFRYVPYVRLSLKCLRNMNDRHISVQLGGSDVLSRTWDCTS
jgi:hypothetical protein